MATLFHRVVFGKKGRFVCVNNLGGISNVTALDWRDRDEPKLLAFDTGPANMPIDLASHRLSSGRHRLDRGGRLASRGKVHEPSVRLWLRDPYFRRHPPKSTGREAFGEPFWDKARAGLRKARLSAEDKD